MTAHPSIHLGDYLSPPGPELATTPYAALHQWDLVAFLSEWDALHQRALDSLPGPRVHPTAYISDHAILGEDVIVGPRVRIHEFSTVRKGSVLGPDVSVGFACEVTKAYLGAGTVLGHRVSVGTSLVGAHVHLSADVNTPAISMWSPHLSRPDREILIRTPDGLCRLGTPRFGALIGDRVQAGTRISLGPGTALGRDCRVTSDVTLTARAIPPQHTLEAPAATDIHVRKHRTR